MKIIFLDRSFEPCFKHGAAGGLVSSFASMLSGTYSAQQSGANVAMQLGAQKEENAINRDWSTAEAEKARQYNTSERESAQQYGIDVMNMQNEYNSPSAQAERLRSAGLNPVVAMSGNVQNVSANSQPSTPQSSPMPSGVSGLSPVSFQPPSLQIGQLMNGVGSMMKDFAEAKKMGVDTDILSRSAEYLIRSNMLDAQGKELVNAWQHLNNEVLEHTKDSQIHKAWNEANKSYNEWLLSGREYERQDLIDKSIKIQNDLNEALKNYHGQNALLLSMEVRSFNDKLNSFLKLNSAQTNAANASANESNERARFNKFDNDLRQHYSEQYADHYIQDLISKNLISSADGKEAKRRLDMLNHLTGDKYLKKLDEALEWIKGKVSIFH